MDEFRRVLKEQEAYHRNVAGQIASLLSSLECPRSPPVQGKRLEYYSKISAVLVGGPMKVTRIAEEMGVGVGLLYQVLSDGVRSGLFVRASRGVYRLPSVSALEVLPGGRSA